MAHTAEYSSVCILEICESCRDAPWHCPSPSPCLLFLSTFAQVRKRRVFGHGVIPYLRNLFQPLALSIPDEEAEQLLVWCVSRRK